MAAFEDFFIKRDIAAVPIPDERQLENLCCADSCGRLWANGLYVTDRADYDKLLYVFVEQGAMFLRYSDEKYLINKGEAFFIDCNNHQVYGTYGDSCVLTFLHFLGGAAHYLYEMITEKTGIILKGAYAQAVYHAIDDVMLNSAGYFSNNVEELSGIVSSSLYELLSLRPKADPMFLKVETIIRDAVTEGVDVGVESLARSCGYSKYYFTRKFSAHFGISPHEFIIRERVARVKNLLINTTHSVGEIALESGFFDTSHMANCFKKREGMSPVAFRRKWRRPV